MNKFGNLYIVALPIGNLEDITIRAIRILKEVDLILVEDTREFIKLAKTYDINTKTESFHNFSEKDKTEKIISLLKNGKNIALTSDRGTPTISDPGFYLINKYRKECNFSNVVPIPGASASLTAQCLSPFGSRFLFFGFANNNDLEGLKNVKYPMIFFESPRRVDDFLTSLLKVFGNRKILICRELTKLNEEIIECELNNIKKFEYLGEFTIIVEGNNNSDEENIDFLINNLNEVSTSKLAEVLSTFFKINKKKIYNDILEKRNV